MEIKNYRQINYRDEYFSKMLPGKNRVTCDVKLYGRYWGWEENQGRMELAGGFILAIIGLKILINQSKCICT